MVDNYVLNAKVVTNAIYEILKHFTLLALLHQHRHGDFFSPYLSQSKMYC